MWLPQILHRIRPPHAAFRLKPEATQNNSFTEAVAPPALPCHG
jgi:hypothetical protein